MGMVLRKTLTTLPIESLGEGLHHLLPYPFRGRMFRDSKVKYFPPVVLQDDEHE